MCLIHWESIHESGQLSHEQFLRFGKMTRIRMMDSLVQQPTSSWMGGYAIFRAGRNVEYLRISYKNGMHSTKFKTNKTTHISMQLLLTLLKFESQSESPMQGSYQQHSTEQRICCTNGSPNPAYGRQQQRPSCCCYSPGWCMFDFGDDPATIRLALRSSSQFIDGDGKGGETDDEATFCCLRLW